ncbi:transposase [Kocuria rosea]|nr:transposase [Kocuria rosea]STX03959.1 transposase, IS605 OrfB family [Kocuria rosea]
MGSVKTVVKLRLDPHEQARDALEATLTLCNTAATEVAATAQHQAVFRNWDLRRIAYTDLRKKGLSSQTAQHVVKKVADAYTTRTANARNGRYGPQDSARYRQIMGTPVTFRPHAAQPYDDRILSWNHVARTVSIWTVAGRVRIPFTGGPESLALVAAHRKGESDLLRDRAGRWFLIATIDTPTPVVHEPNGFLGVDLGIVNIATTSDGANWSGGAVTTLRKKNQRVRRSLQKRGTKSAKRRLKARSGREQRFVRDVNHRISKAIVETAERTGKGVAVENLTGIRARVRHRKPQRSTFHSWAFAQLGAFLAYKAARAGVAFAQVDPAYTSRQCSGCGHVERSNRVDQANFACHSCGVSLHADHNAAINIAARGHQVWGRSQPSHDAA